MSKNTDNSNHQIKPILIALLFLAALIFLLWEIYTADKPESDFGITDNGETQTQTAPLQNMRLPLANTKEYREALKQIDINNPRSCIPCHKTIYDEWFNSYHRYAHEDFIFRLFSFYDAKTDKPGIPMCENCHISESTLEVEPLKQPVSRRDAKTPLRLGDGIDCASCHRKAHQIVGKNGTSIGCKAVGNSYFGTSKYCGGCHSTFLPNTIHEYEEWAQNPKPINVKKTCVQCHMPDIKGDKIDGKAISYEADTTEKKLQTRKYIEKTHKQHNFYAGHDLIMLKSAVDFSAKFETIENDPYVVVRVTNKGTGHHFPTGTAKRRVNIFVAVEDGSGQYIGGGEYDMRKPKKEQDVPGTQVVDGGWREFSFGYNFPKIPGGKAHVVVTYKHYPAATPGESIVIFDKYYKLPD